MQNRKRQVSWRKNNYFSGKEIASMKYASEIISKNIKKERKKLNMTQEKLGKKISKTLNAKRELTGKQISIYENPKNDTIPPLKILLTMCEIFHCELGYLLGEESYSNGTKNLTIVAKETGFTEKSLENIREVMGISSNLHYLTIESQRYQKVINKFVSSSRFIQLVIDLKILDDIYSKHCSYLKECDKELAEINYYLDKIDPVKATFIRDKHDYPLEALTPEEISIHNSLSDYEKSIINGFNDTEEDHDKQLAFERDMKCQRYIIQETMSFLLNELYPIDNPSL